MKARPNFWKWIGLVTALMVGVVRADQAAAEFQAYLVQHHYESIRTNAQGENNQTLKAFINGKRVTLLIDSGAMRTVITEACARRLHLDVHDTGYTGDGVGGETNGHLGIAAISSFKIGNGEINHLSTIMILPGHSNMFADGLFGFDALSLNAAIVPVGGHGLLIKPGPTPAARIDAFMRARRFTPIPLQVYHNELRIGGTLDGKPMLTQIDTGCALSIFDLSFVKKNFKGQIHGLEGAYGVGVDGRNSLSYVFTPHQLKLGDYMIPPVTVMAVQSPMLEKEGIDALIGYDILGTHRAVIDTGAGVLWLR